MEGTGEGSGELQNECQRRLCVERPGSSAWFAVSSAVVSYGSSKTLNCIRAMKRMGRFTVQRDRGVPVSVFLVDRAGAHTNCLSFY